MRRSSRKEKRPIFISHSFYAGVTKLVSLSTNIQNYLTVKIVWRFAIDLGCSDIDFKDFGEITVWELYSEANKDKTSAPGEEITYSVLWLIVQIPGNPLLHLFK